MTNTHSKLIYEDLQGCGTMITAIGAEDFLLPFVTWISDLVALQSKSVQKQFILFRRQAGDNWRATAIVPRLPNAGRDELMRFFASSEAEKFLIFE